MTDQRAKDIKGIELAICCALLPNIIKDILQVRGSIAYPVGIFVGFLVAYWLPPVIRPPKIRFSFVAWIGIALAASVGYWLIKSLITSLWGA